MLGGLATVIKTRECDLNQSTVDFIVGRVAKIIVKTMVTTTKFTNFFSLIVLFSL